VDSLTTIAFSTNDERTAKRVSDALGTATEMRAMKNYAGHRLSPWLGHLMVSRSETARQLLTPGEIMQLPPGDEIVMVAGVPPIRAKKARYYEDVRFKERVLSPPALSTPEQPRSDDWSGLPVPARPEPDESQPETRSDDDDPTQSERRLQHELHRVKPVEKKRPIESEFEPPDDTDEDDAVRNRQMVRQMQGIAQQVSLDPGDNMEL
jgi:type IV secretion system protein VirD4